MHSHYHEWYRDLLWHWLELLIVLGIGLDRLLIDTLFVNRGSDVWFLYIDLLRLLAFLVLFSALLIQIKQEVVRHHLSDIMTIFILCLLQLLLVVLFQQFKILQLPLFFS